ncbi:MAG: SWIM zinc finger family protein [Deltaproteobacteria bacterium]|nr:SWIM zinc finger family protein [Deltaproteobacteria bacterium]
MTLDPQQIVALAPDASSAAAGRKLATPAPWKTLGRDARAVWGECKGSALYQVRVDLRDLSSKCSCPSRKFPCKHALGLLFLAEGEPQRVVEASPPEWVRDWIDKRDQAEQKREARASAPQKAPDPVAQKRRLSVTEAREARVDKGVEALDRFLQDLVRTGLAGLESQPGTFEAQAARLVDAQATGLASRVRRLEHAAGGDPSWPDAVLDRLGRIALLARAWSRLDRLEGPIVDDIRQAIGFSLEKDEVAARGERVRDVWAVVAQHTDDDERLRSQRSWLRGMSTRRTALILQFAPGAAPFPQAIVPSTAFDAELIFWPSATPTRALVDVRHGTDRSFAQAPGFAPIAEALRGYAEQLANNPWHERTLFTLGGVVPVKHEGRWFVRDASGAALPIPSRTPWLLLAISAGAPVDLVGEWSGARLLPLAAIERGVHHPLHIAEEE